MNYKCQECGNEWSDDAPESNSSPRPKCPKCGANKTLAFLTVKADAFSSSSTTAVAQLVPLTKILMDDAGRLFDKKEYNVAVVVAQTACEIATEQAIRNGLMEKQLFDTHGEFLNGKRYAYTFTDNFINFLFELATGDRIDRGTSLFWPGLKEAVRLRNNIVHHGHRADVNSAASAIKAANALLEYLREKHKVK